ncbi:hypothetical protein M2302_004512 [Micromonospora sp. A200]|uniref:hypothetical protein n=1 Tax=Micromonospora sp. A200 TaxID=2940568 RepID=UPI00247400AA|nr:hypothetical protein [Micromonospora sp. A200]MDH6464314.1 hypothetical protein [Micromonospora sp. A200]
MILDFPVTKGGRAQPEPSVAYSESLTGALYLDKPDKLTAYRSTWKSLERWLTMKHNRRTRSRG